MAVLPCSNRIVTSQLNLYVYSQVLMHRLTKWTEINNFLSDNQFGFQKGKSTTDCIFLFHSIIAKTLNSKKKLYCVFIDLFL